MINILLLSRICRCSLPFSVVTADRGIVRWLVAFGNITPANTTRRTEPVPCLPEVVLASSIGTTGFVTTHIVRMDPGVGRTIPPDLPCGLTVALVIIFSIIDRISWRREPSRTGIMWCYDDLKILSSNRNWTPAQSLIVIIIITTRDISTSYFFLRSTSISSWSLDLFI